MHSDYVRQCIESDYYSFKHLRSVQTKQNIDMQIASLATNYWQRNRSDLKEYFINWTCDKWNNDFGNVLAVEKDVIHNGWINCGVDPIYPKRKYENNRFDAPYLMKTGELQKMFIKAKHRVFVSYNVSKMQHKAKAKAKLFKVKCKKLFKKLHS